MNAKYVCFLLLSGLLVSCASPVTKKDEGRGDKSNAGTDAGTTAGFKLPDTRRINTPQIDIYHNHNVDADFEARFSRGELKLKVIEPSRTIPSVRSLEPFLKSPALGKHSGEAIALSINNDTAATNALRNADGLEIHVFAIGQADSMLLIGPAPERRTMLVDLGETGWNSRKNCAYVRDRIVELTGEPHVDYLMLSHYHTDHIGHPRTENERGRIQGGGGIFCLLDGTSEFFTVGTLIDRGDEELDFKPTRQKSHEAIILSAPAWIQNGTLGQRIAADFSDSLIDLGDAIDIQVVSTAGKVFAGDSGALAKARDAEPDTYSIDEQASPNDFSIAMEISVGEFEFFTGGDLSGAPGEAPYPLAIENGHGQIYTNVESHLVNHWLATGRENDIEVYRVNHHGSQNSSTTDLANALKPELVIYSAGGRFGHPKRDIVNRFQDLDADQMVTSEVDDKEWGDDGFPEEYGNGWINPTGDIFIFVPLAGDYYSVGTAEQVFEYPIFNDAEESTFN